MVPTANPVTTPVLLIVATVVFKDTQGFTAAGVPDPISVMLEF